jgi:hypothetical protein
MQLDGDRAELQRIKNELRALNLVPTTPDALFSEPGLTHPKQFLPFCGSNTVKPSSKCEDEERDDLLSTCFYDSIYLAAKPVGRHSPGELLRVSNP